MSDQDPATDIVNATTVLTALDNLQKSYIEKKKIMNTTLTAILADTKTIEYCVSNLITNFGDKAELSVKLEKAKNSYNEAKTQANVSEEELKNIHDKVTELETEINDKEAQNSELLQKIKDATNHMKSMCSIGSAGNESSKLKSLEDKKTRIKDKIENLDKSKWLPFKNKKKTQLQKELGDVEEEIRNFTQTAVNEREAKFKKMITALQSIHGPFPEDNSLKQILNETADSEVERLMNPIINSLKVTTKEETELLETAKKFMPNKAQPEQTTEIQEPIAQEANVEQLEEKAEDSIVPADPIVPTEDQQEDQQGGYKHSSRKSRSKSTRKRVKNKFKKIKIFSKKRSRKKKK